MNDKITLSVFQIAEMFPNEETAQRFLEKQLWPMGPVCPFCKETKRLCAMRAGGYVRCNACVKDFTIRTGTIFERSHIPLHKWIHAIYLLLTSRKGISSIQLSKQLSITQKSAWFMLHRLREACGKEMEVLNGIVEIDETYIGGKEDNKHENKKNHNGREPSGKIPVLGMRQRKGFVKALPISNTKAKTIHAEIKKAIAAGSNLYTDDALVYNRIKGFKHKSVNHSMKEYVRGTVHTNGIETVWSVLKRGLHGVYHKASPKHLARYVNEFSFRLNEGNCEIPTMDRITSLIKATPGKRISYLTLKASPGDAEAVAA